MQTFLDETVSEVWDEEKKLRDFVRQRNNIKSYIQGSLGANLIFKYKSLGMINHSADLAEVAKETLTEFLKESGAGGDAIKLGYELIDFARLRMTDIFDNLEKDSTHTFHFDVARFTKEVKPVSVESYKLNHPLQYFFRLGDIFLPPFTS